MDKIRPGSSPGFGTKISNASWGIGSCPIPRFYLSRPRVVHRAHGKTGKVKKGEIMNEGLLLIIIIAGWFILNRFVLPRLGIRT